MPFLTSQDIKALIVSSGQTLISDADPNNIKPASYELTLSGEYCLSGTSAQRLLKEEGELIVIPPGQFAVLLTKEEVRIPSYILGFISIKASKKFNGLVNVSGFHVDPGFSGRLKFSVHNAGPEAIALDVGSPLFPIWLYDLGKQDANPYKGAHNNQKRIDSEDAMHLQGDSASPAALKLRIDRASREYDVLRRRVDELTTLARTVLWSFLVAVAAGLLIWVITKR